MTRVSVYRGRIRPAPRYPDEEDIYVITMARLHHDAMLSVALRSSRVGAAELGPRGKFRCIFTAKFIAYCS